MAKISHPKIKQPSFGEKRPKFSDLQYQGQFIVTDNMIILTIRDSSLLLII
jgi:hypothetical protein